MNRDNAIKLCSFVADMGLLAKLGEKLHYSQLKSPTSTHRMEGRNFVPV